MIKTFPVAETFHSLQGEGQWVGTPMFFLRLAGCNVGRSAKALKIDTPFPILPGGDEAKACCTFDGRIFPCDTDYKLKEDLTFQTIYEQVWEQHICITGGEPLLQIEKINAFIEWLREKKDKKRLMIHIETSGTLLPYKHLPIQSRLILPDCWITVAPKLNCLERMIERADEIKLLVDEDWNFDRLTNSMLTHRNVFLCPINEVNTNNQHNIELCQQILHERPNWRVSVQMHKFLGIR